jgi:DNA-binding transcriptional ArsR family regulator
LHKEFLVCQDRCVHGPSVAQVFGALADPTRLAIVTRLAAGEATVTELTEPFELTQQAVSLHLKVLENAGVVSRRKVGRARPATLEVDRLLDAIEWVEARRREWTERHARLAGHLSRVGSDTRS